MTVILRFLQRNLWDKMNGKRGGCGYEWEGGGLGGGEGDESDDHGDGERECEGVDAVDVCVDADDVDVGESDRDSGTSYGTQIGSVTHSNTLNLNVICRFSVSHICCDFAASAL